MRADTFPARPARALKHFAKNEHEYRPKTCHLNEGVSMARYPHKLYFSKMRVKFARIYRCLASAMKWTHSPADRGPWPIDLSYAEAGWLLALDHRRPVAQPAIRLAQLVPLALVLSLFLSLGTGIAFGLGWARPSRLRKLASSDFVVDRGR